MLLILQEAVTISQEFFRIGRSLSFFACVGITGLAITFLATFKSREMIRTRRVHLLLGQIYFIFSAWSMYGGFAVYYWKNHPVESTISSLFLYVVAFCTYLFAWWAYRDRLDREADKDARIAELEDRLSELKTPKQESTK